RTLAEQLIGTAGTDFTEFAHFAPGQHFHAAPGGYCGVNLVCRHCCFRLIWTVILRHSRPQGAEPTVRVGVSTTRIIRSFPSGACHARRCPCPLPLSVVYHWPALPALPRSGVGRAQPGPRAP